ncbi:DNA repair protein RecO [Bacillaceae bacterium]
MLVKSEGIVLRSTNYGEGDKILTLFTREHGKIGLVAKGARKPKSRLAAVSQLFTYGHYLYFAGAHLATLSQGEIIDSFREIRQDLQKAAYAAYIVELLDKLTEERERNPFLFQLLYQTLSYLDEGKDAEILTRIFEVKMLQAAGLRPRLDGCLRCRADEGPFFFSVREGGLLCARCKEQAGTPAVVLSTPAAKLLRLFQYFDLMRLGNIAVKKETRAQLKQALHAFIDEHTGLRFKARSFIDQLEKIVHQEDREA